MPLASLVLADPPIGVGKERACYLHPDDSNRVVKIQIGEIRKQTQRELKIYRRLQKRGLSNYRHIPRLYGTVETNLGRGLVFDRVLDFNGETSMSILEYVSKGVPLPDFEPYLDELHRYLVCEEIVFCVDMSIRNTFLQRDSVDEARLVVIDGLGNHTLINWFDSISYVVRRKIERRWVFFHKKLYKDAGKLTADLSSGPISLEQVLGSTVRGG